MWRAFKVGPTRCNFPSSKQELIVKFAAVPYVQPRWRRNAKQVLPPADVYVSPASAEAPQADTPLNPPSLCRCIMDAAWMQHGRGCGLAETHAEGSMMFPQSSICSCVERTQIPSRRRRNPNKIRQQLREQGGTLGRRAALRPTFPFPTQRAAGRVWQGGGPTLTPGHLHSTRVMAILILAGAGLILGT